MNKKNLRLFVLTLVLVTITGAYLIFAKNISAKYLRAANQAKGIPNKLENTLISNALWPQNEKKVAIASYYLVLNKPELAERQFEAIWGQSRFLYLTGYSLETNQAKKASDYLKKVPKEEQEELRRLQDLLAGNLPVGQGPEAKTDYGRTVQVIAGLKDLKSAPNYSYIANLYLQAFDAQSKTNTLLNFSQALLEANQPRLSIALLGNDSLKGLKDTYLLMSRGYQSLGRNDLALRTITDGANLYPEDKNLQKQALELAGSQGNKEQALIFKLRLEKISTLEKGLIEP